MSWRFLFRDEEGLGRIDSNSWQLLKPSNWQLVAKGSCCPHTQKEKWEGEKALCSAASNLWLFFLRQLSSELTGRLLLSRAANTRKGWRRPQWQWWWWSRNSCHRTSSADPVIIRFYIHHEWGRADDVDDSCLAAQCLPAAARWSGSLPVVSILSAPVSLSRCAAAVPGNDSCTGLPNSSSLEFMARELSCQLSRWSSRERGGCPPPTSSSWCSRHSCFSEVRQRTHIFWVGNGLLLLCYNI